MRAGRYLLILAATIAGLALVSATLAVLVDPYRMYGTPTVPGLTVLKPRIYQQRGLAKVRQLERVRPQTVLLGNSRVEVGLDPLSALWPRDNRPVFNAAEGGGDLFHAWRMLQEAVAVRRPRIVVLGLDIADFLATRAEATPPIGPDERRLLVGRDGEPNSARAAQIWRDRLATTLTIDALVDSIDTLFDQDPKTSVTMTPDGLDPLLEYRAFVARSGYHELFAQKDALYEAEYRAYRPPDFSDPGANGAFADLGRILATAAAARVPLVVFIYPYHARYLEMLHQLGLWQSFENWKETLARMIDAANGAASVSIRLVDFSDYDRYSTEAVPPDGDVRTEMRWYWESGHYKAALGERIIARLFPASGEPAPEWGRDLRPDTIEADLAAIRQDRATYLAPGTASQRN